MRLETLILNILLKDNDYAKKVLTHLSPDYFKNKPESVAFQLIDEFYGQYKKSPTHDILKLKLDGLVGLSETEFSETKKIIHDASVDRYEYDLQWMLDETEKFCREKALYNAVMQSVRIINGDEPKMSEGMIPSLLSKALTIGFNRKIGHDYFEQMEQRYDYYHLSQKRHSCSIDIINKITNNIPVKTLNLILSPTGGGKSAVMCSLAADYLLQGLNVAYITLELAEERVGERIDANVLNVPIKDINKLSKNVFVDRLQQIKSKTIGRLFIKEFPTMSASAIDFEAYMDELETKEGVKIDVLMVDYLGICASARYKNASNINTYNYQKAVAEELRALAMVKECLVWSAVQTNRTGYGSTDFDLDVISDSAAVAHTADFILGLIRSEELDELGQCMFKQLKNRYGDPNYFKRFVVGFDLARMKMYNIEASGQIRNDSSSQESTPTPSTTDRYSKTTKIMTGEDFDYGN